MSETAQISFYTHSLSGLARMRQTPSTDPARARLGVQARFATTPDGPVAHTIEWVRYQKGVRVNMEPPRRMNTWSRRVSCSV